MELVEAAALTTLAGAAFVEAVADLPAGAVLAFLALAEAAGLLAEAGFGPVSGFAADFAAGFLLPAAEDGFFVARAPFDIVRTTSVLPAAQIGPVHRCRNAILAGSSTRA